MQDHSMINQLFQLFKTFRESTLIYANGGKTKQSVNTETHGIVAMLPFTRNKQKLK